MNTLDPNLFALLGVNGITREPAKLKAVVEKEKLNWRTFADSGEITTVWASRSTPSYYLIDHKGIIHSKWIGWPGGKALDIAIEDAMAAAKAAGKAGKQ